MTTTIGDFIAAAHAIGIEATPVHAAEAVNIWLGNDNRLPAITVWWHGDLLRWGPDFRHYASLAARPSVLVTIVLSSLEDDEEAGDGS